MPKPKRLAITISGAVSLGSFEAGVLYEVLSAIAQHNEHPETLKNPGQERIEIDVMTGASAGGMTATIAVQKLLYDADALRFEKQNAFYLPWVSEVSLEGLLALSQDDDGAQSILSTDLVKRIATTHLLKRYEASSPPARKKHPAAARSIRLGLALANLNGVDYRRALAVGGTFTYTRHQDEFVATFHDNLDDDDSAKAWRFPCEAAVSCGAFPFAFRLIPLVRNITDYSESSGHALAPWPSATGTFAYTDGGTFQNEPLGLAKKLVDEIDDHEDGDTRFYLFVSPGEKAGSSAPGFQALQPHLSGVLGRLVSSIYQQARFHDWIVAEDINDLVRTLDKRAGELKDLIIQPVEPLDPETVLRPAAEPLLNLLFAGSPAEPLGDARDRLRKQYAEEYDTIVHGRPSATPLRKDPSGAPVWATGVTANADLFIDAILVLETAAHLGARDEMVIYGITALDTELASNPICAFGGFFDQSFREHDYAVGRNKARAFLRRLNNPNPPSDSRRGRKLSSLGPIRCAIPADLPVDHQLDGLKFENLPPSLLQRFEDRLFTRIDSLLAEFVSNAAVRWGVMKFLVRPKLQKFLGRPAS